MTYNLTNFTNTTNVVDMIGVANDITGGWYIGLVFISIFIILFMSMKNYQTDTVLIVSSFVTSLIGLILWSLNWIGMQWLWMSVVILVGSIIVKVMRG